MALTRGTAGMTSGDPQSGYSTAMLTLHHSPGACSLAPHILLHETGVKADLVLSSTVDGTTKTDAFKAINPKGRVPVLIIGQGAEAQTLTEVPAISAFISSHAPHLQLMGRDAIEQARVLEWFNWLCGTVHGQSVAGMMRPYRFTDDETAFDAIKAKARLTFADCAKMIDAKLQGRMWACGDHYTAVDAILLFLFRMGNRTGFKMAEDHPAFTAWAKRMEARPAVQAMLAAEGISLWS
jgi:glutathione S-transferase